MSFFDKLDGLDEKLALRFSGTGRRTMLLSVYGAVVGVAAVAFLAGIVAFSPEPSVALMLAGPYVLSVAIAFELGRTVGRSQPGDEGSET